MRGHFNYCGKLRSFRMELKVFLTTETLETLSAEQRFKLARTYHCIFKITISLWIKMSFFYIYIYRGIRKLFYYFILTIFISTIKHLTSHYGIVLHFSFCSKCCKNPTTTIIIVFLIKPCSFLYFKGTGYAEHYDSLPSAIDYRSLKCLG